MILQYVLDEREHYVMGTLQVLRIGMYVVLKLVLIKQELIESPSIMTVHAPHPPWRQEDLVPVWPATPRR